MGLFNECKVTTRTTEAKTKLKIIHVSRDANQLALNCKRLPYFRPFTYGIITQNTNIMYFYKDHSAIGSLARGREKTKKATENDIEIRACSQESHVLHKNSSIFFFP